MIIAPEEAKPLEPVESLPRRLREADMRCRERVSRYSLSNTLESSIEEGKFILQRIERQITASIPEPCASCSAKVIESMQHPQTTFDGIEFESRARCAFGRGARCPDEYITFGEVENNFKKFGQNIPPKPIEIKQELPSNYGDW